MRMARSAVWAEPRRLAKEAILKRLHMSRLSHCALRRFLVNFELLSIATERAAPLGLAHLPLSYTAPLPPHTPHHARSAEAGALGPRSTVARTVHGPQRAPGALWAKRGRESSSKALLSVEQRRSKSTRTPLTGCAARLLPPPSIVAHVAPTSRPRLTAARRAAAGTPRSRPSCRGWRAPAGDRAGLSASLRASRPPARVSLRASATVTVSFSGKCLGSV